MRFCEQIDKLISSDVASAPELPSRSTVLLSEHVKYMQIYFKRISGQLFFCIIISRTEIRYLWDLSRGQKIANKQFYSLCQ